METHEFDIEIKRGGEIRIHVKGVKGPGCMDYVWSADPLNAARIYIYERWESTEALDSHFKGPHYTAMRDTIAAHGISAVDVWKYQPAKKGAVYDKTGVPRADFFDAE